jgi:hypothetical protein
MRPEGRSMAVSAINLLKPAKKMTLMILREILANPVIG